MNRRRFFGFAVGAPVAVVAGHERGEPKYDVAGSSLVVSLDVDLSEFEDQMRAAGERADKEVAKIEARWHSIDHDDGTRTVIRREIVAVDG